MRSTVVALVVSAVFLVVATTVVPVRVRLEPKVLTCNTVLQHRGDDPIASALCRKAGAYRLRAMFGIGALLSVLSFMPLVLRRRAQLFVWAATMAAVAIGSVVLVTADGIRLENVFFDL
jgi:hypothetical protein